MRRTLIWDLPIRLFHWGLVISIIGSVVTANIDELDLHARFGFAACVLLIFRVIWGVVGSETARFAAFVRGPATVIAYLRGAWSGVGHNPLGALSVVALLVVVSGQVATGIFSNDDVFFEGPWAGWIGSRASAEMTGWHERFEFAMYALVALHLAAIIVYRLRGKDLITPMVTGRGEEHSDHAPRMTPVLIAVPVLGVAIFLAGLVFRYWIT